MTGISLIKICEKTVVKGKAPVKSSGVPKSGDWDILIDNGN